MKNIFIGIISLALVVLIGLLYNAKNESKELIKLAQESLLHEKKSDCNILVSDYAEKNKKPGLFESGEGFIIHRSTFNEEFNNCVVQSTSSILREDNIIGIHNKIYDLTNNTMIYDYFNFIGEEDGEEIIDEETSKAFLDAAIIFENKYFGSLSEGTLYERNRLAE